MTDPQQIPFSARNRGPNLQIDNDFPKSAKNGLMHLLVDLVEKGYVADWGAASRELQRIARLSPTEYNKSSPSSMRQARLDFETALDALSWQKSFDFCERLYCYLANEVGFYAYNNEWEIKTQKSEVKEFIAKELQRLFSEEGLAFEFSEGLVHRRGRKHTVDVTSRAQVVLGDPLLLGARKHYEKALQFFRNPTKPDYENAVKEAVCSVEAAGKSLFPAAKASTLGDLAKWLVTTKDVNVPKALAQTITAIYAYRSGGNGVGHGGADGGVASTEVAEYVLAVCASQIIYLVDLANGQEESIPF
jgi:hypothetical protein